MGLDIFYYPIGRRTVSLFTCTLLAIKIQFKRQSLFKCWLFVVSGCPLLSQKAVKMLLSFVTTYLCEAAFSACTNKMTKYRSRLEQRELSVFCQKYFQELTIWAEQRKNFPLTKCHFLAQILADFHLIFFINFTFYLSEGHRDFWFFYWFIWVPLTFYFYLYLGLRNFIFIFLGIYGILFLLV